MRIDRAEGCPKGGLDMPAGIWVGGCVEFDDEDVDELKLDGGRRKRVERSIVPALELWQRDHCEPPAADAHQAP